jgi:hypothetical protein
MVEIGRWSPSTKRQESKSVISLVDCTVRVSPILARLIRKCAATETGGASAHDALLASAAANARVKAPGGGLGRRAPSD